MKLPESDTLKHVKYFKAPDNQRPVAIFVSREFDEFEKFPPFMDTEEEIKHVREAYKIANPLLERTTKAHLTDNSWPLQIILLERDPGGTTLPHYHIPTEAAARYADAASNSDLPKWQGAGSYFHERGSCAWRDRYATK